MVADANLTLKAAARLPELLRDGRAVNFSTIHRWAVTGILVGGQRVKLRTWLVGGQRVTSESAVREFLVALSPPPAYRPAPARRERELRRMEDSLERSGW